MDRQSGVERSRLARSVRDAEVGGSSPLTPTRMTHHFSKRVSDRQVTKEYGMQAYRISRSVFTTGWHLMAVCPCSHSERVASDKRRAVLSLPGHARCLDPYPHSHHRRRR